MYISSAPLFSVLLEFSDCRCSDIFVTNFAFLIKAFCVRQLLYPRLICAVVYVFDLLEVMITNESIISFDNTYCNLRAQALLYIIGDDQTFKT